MAAAKNLGQGVVARGGEIMLADPREITVIEGWNPRIDFGDLDELKHSIIENGVLKPIELRRMNDGSLALVDGERRVRATMMAIDEGHEIVSIPAVIHKKGFSATEALVNATISNEGKPWLPLERAEIYRRFIGYGWTQGEIAKRFGKSQGHVAQTLALLEASPEVRTALQDGDLSTKEARAIITEARKSDDPEDFQRAATEQTVTAKAEAVEARKNGTAPEGKKGKGRPKAEGINPVFLNLLKQEVKDLFGKDALADPASILRAGTFTDEQQYAFNLGRIALLCEMCGKGRDLADIITLLK